MPNTTIWILIKNPQSFTTPFNIISANKINKIWVFILNIEVGVGFKNPVFCFCNQNLYNQIDSLNHINRKTMIEISFYGVLELQRQRKKNKHSKLQNLKVEISAIDMA